MIFEYLIILIVMFIITIALEKTQHLHLYKNRRERLEIVALFFIIGVLWDSFAIWRGHWVFPPENNIGIVIGVMPIEEYLFAIIVPYFIITLYKLVDSKWGRKRKKKVVQRI